MNSHGLGDVSAQQREIVAQWRQPYRHALARPGWSHRSELLNGPAPTCMFFRLASPLLPLRHKTACAVNNGQQHKGDNSGIIVKNAAIEEGIGAEQIDSQARQGR